MKNTINKKDNAKNGNCKVIHYNQHDISAREGVLSETNNPKYLASKKLHFYCLTVLSRTLIREGLLFNRENLETIGYVRLIKQGLHELLEKAISNKIIKKTDIKDEDNFLDCLSARVIQHIESRLNTSLGATIVRGTKENSYRIVIENGEISVHKKNIIDGKMSQDIKIDDKEKMLSVIESGIFSDVDIQLLASLV